MTEKQDPRNRGWRQLSQGDDIHDTDIPEQQQTVQFEDALADPNVTVDPNATIDPHATVDPEVVAGMDETIQVNATIASDADFDPYGTVDSESSSPSKATVAADEEPESIGLSTVIPKSTARATAIDQTIDTVGLDKTVAFSANDRTVQFTPSEVLSRDLRTADPSKKTVANAQIDQTIELNSPGSRTRTGKDTQGTTAVDLSVSPGSVMNDTCVTRTINPRELAGEDAAFWNNLSRGSAPVSDPSRLSPAINRSLSETKLNLRGQVLLPPQSEVTDQPDYRLVRLLGKGGMGNVYVARQGSLDRLVALKVIKPLEADKKKKLEQRGALEQVERERRLQFISEAVVTGDLDHPNIVPIHDIAVTGDNTLFYSMKRVSGTPWSKVIEEKSQEENLEILLKVSDAIGFAHTRGVIHRDIKPENIMLGDFGVVMVMDWGLALAKPEFEKVDSVHPTTGLGGSPAYMAPEMAIGPVDRIGPQSDIYLLGATLFQIITGLAPHYATNVSECLKVVASNKIREVSSEHQGELMQIALKAMATRIEDRYPDVASFQNAIRSHRSHSESIKLVVKAQQDLDRARKSSAYDDYSRAMFGFEEALVLWQDNSPAKQGLAVARLGYATEAQRKGDFDLGLSLLDKDDENHQPLISQLQDGKKDRVARTKRLAVLRVATKALLAIILIGGGAAYYVIRMERDNAIESKEIATKAAEAEKKAKNEAIAAEAKAVKLATSEEKQRKIAEDKTTEAVAAKLIADAAAASEKNQRKIAEEKTEEAVALKLEADEAAEQERKAKEAAEDAKKAADVAKEKALYETYVSQIGLAKASIDQNGFDEARRILSSLATGFDKQQPPWEWRWLWHQTTQSRSSIATASPVSSIEISGPMGTYVAVLESGAVQIGSVDAKTALLSGLTAVPVGNQLASAAAWTPDQRNFVVGTKSGDIEIWDAAIKNSLQAWPAHQSAINRLKFIGKDLLVSASDDRTIRLWSLAGGVKLMATCWNLGPVKDIAISGDEKAITLVAAIAEAKSGRVTVWRLTENEKKEGEWQARLSGEFQEHGVPVLSVDLSPKGDLAVSGDDRGNVFVWSPKDTRPTKYAERFERAKQALSTEADFSQKGLPGSSPAEAVAYKRFADPELAMERSVEEKSQTPAHSDRVHVVRFSDDGKQLLSGGEDYLLRLWDVESGRQLKKLRGHGGWILDADFVGSTDVVLSASADATIRSWKPSVFVNAAVPNQTAEMTDSPVHDEEILSARLDAEGSHVVTASRDRTARVWKINPTTMASERIATLRDDSAPVALKEGTLFVAQSFAASAMPESTANIATDPNALVYIASADATVRVWDLNRGTERFQIGNTGLNTSIALSRDGRYLLTRSSSADTKSILWLVDPMGNTPPRELYRLVGHKPGRAVTAMAISSDGSRLFTGDNLGTGILWNGKTGQPIGDPIEVVGTFRINAAEFAPHANELFIASDNQQLSVIDLASNKVRQSFSHPGYVTQLSLSTDGLYAVTLSEQKTADAMRSEAFLWNLTDGKSQVLDRAIVKIKDGKVSGTQERIAVAQFGSDGHSIAIGKYLEADRTANQNDSVIETASTENRKPALSKSTGRVVIWNISDGGKAEVAKGFELPMSLGGIQATMMVSPRRLLTLNGDAAFLWDVDKKVELTSYRANASVHHANFSSDGRFVITGSHSIKVWDVESEKSIAKIEQPHESPMTCVEFTPKKGSYDFASSATDGTVEWYRFDPTNNTTTELRKWVVNEAGEAIHCVRFSKDGSMLIAVGANGTAKLIRLDAEEPHVRYDMPNSGNFISAAFSSDGRYIVVGSDDWKARLWEVVSPGQEIPKPIEFQGHSDDVDDVKFLSSAAGPLRVFTASRDKSARVWDPRLSSDDKRAREMLNLRQHSQGVTAVDANESGNVVVTAGRDAMLVVWPASDVSELPVVVKQ